jgi:hypothetical protein
MRSRFRTWWNEAKSYWPSWPSSSPPLTAPSQPPRRPAAPGPIRRPTRFPREDDGVARHTTAELAACPRTSSRLGTDLLSRKVERLRGRGLEEGASSGAKSLPGHRPPRPPAVILRRARGKSCLSPLFRVVQRGPQPSAPEGPARLACPLRHPQPSASCPRSVPPRSVGVGRKNYRLVQRTTGL